MRKRPHDETEERPLVCQWDGCASCVFRDETELGEHVNTVHANVKGTCCWNGCVYLGKTKQALQTHMRTHTGEKPFTCTECGKAFAESGKLKVHMRTHTGEKPYTCTVCEKVFAESGHLTEHTRTHTGERPYKCEVCEQAFTTSGHLTTHMRRHTGERPHTCTVCEKAFAESGDLTKHMRTHTGEKPYTCTVCEKAFAMSGDLTKHMRTHTGEKPYKCTVCEKAFAESGNLTTHMRTHTGEKPYTCTECGQAFTTSGVLTTHMRTHTGEKPYTCTFCDCDYASITSGILKSHVLRHHTGPWCVICKECWVPKENMICGRCNLHANYGVKEKRFFDFVYDYDERLAEVCFTLRDEAMGCGVRKRPDGLMQLQTKAAVVNIEAAMETLLVEDDYQVKLIIECDEHQHNDYSPSCELARLQEIQERDNDAVYVLRYNVDQPDAFDETKIGAFCDRVLEVLEGGFLRAVESPTLFEIEYFGYTEARKTLLEEEMRRQFSFE